MPEQFSGGGTEQSKRGTEGGQELQEQLQQLERFKSKWDRLKDILSDPQVQKALPATYRSVANFAITVFELFPIVGETVGYGADGLKIISKLSANAATIEKKLTGKTRFSELARKHLDLTPDVSLAVALGTEIPDLMTGTMLPSHMAELLIQLKSDIPRMRASLKRARDIWRQRIQETEADTQLQTALDHFTKE